LIGVFLDLRRGVKIAFNAVTYCQPCAALEGRSIASAAYVWAAIVPAATTERGPSGLLTLRLPVAKRLKQVPPSFFRGTNARRVCP